jgi:hypothetical protein
VAVLSENYNTIGGVFGRLMEWHAGDKISVTPKMFYYSTRPRTCAFGQLYQLKERIFVSGWLDKVGPARSGSSTDRSLPTQHHSSN